MARKVRIRRVRVSGQEKLLNLVNPYYDAANPFEGLHVAVLYQSLKVNDGYIACQKCNRFAHELDLFRRKLAIPRITIEGIKARLFFPVAKNNWVSLLHAWREAERDLDAPDLAARRQKFEELLAIASGREFSMRVGLHNNETIRGRIRVLCEQGVLYEQEILPGIEAQ